VGGYAFVWGDAMRAALHRDNSELCKMLMDGNSPPPEVSRFLAFLLAPRKNGRPRLPEEFKWLNDDLPLYDAVLDFEMKLANWHDANKREPFPRELMLQKIARSHGITPDKLENKLRRGSGSGRKTKLFPY
jgi:hypothetical protein